MQTYKNISGKKLTFYGVTFNPNEIKEVPGYINHIKMVRVKETSAAKKTLEIITLPKQESPKVDEQKPKRQYNRRKQQ